MNDGLPTKQRPIGRGLKYNIACAFCDSHDKNEYHIFLNYKLKVEFWRKSIPKNANPLIKNILKVKDIIQEVAIFDDTKNIKWILGPKRDLSTKSALILVQTGSFQNLKNSNEQSMEIKDAFQN